MKLKKIVPSLLLLLVPATTIADSGFIVQGATVTKVSSGGASSFGFNVSGGTGTCADSRIKFDSALINGDGNIDAMNRAYSALTAALVSNSKIDVWADDTSDCESATSIDILD
ncbi:DUF5992 family protein [Microbulbifer sp. TRSA001]|uniref:DUF5992 family protein n=1 Tax=Microbulbifer sp. TRSA001 TaxID=3243381 RepID=UPI004039C534